MLSQIWLPKKKAALPSDMMGKIRRGRLFDRGRMTLPPKPLNLSSLPAKRKRGGGKKDLILGFFLGTFLGYGIRQF